MIRSRIVRRGVVIIAVLVAAIGLARVAIELIAEDVLADRTGRADERREELRGDVNLLECSHGPDFRRAVVEIHNPSDEVRSYVVDIWFRYDDGGTSTKFVEASDLGPGSTRRAEAVLPGGSPDVRCEIGDVFLERPPRP